MADRPALMNTPMVQAVLREIEEPGSGKTQTRRELVPQPRKPAETLSQCHWRIATGYRTTKADPAYVEAVRLLHYDAVEIVAAGHRVLCRPGDRLWVRETWAHYHTVNHVRRSDGRAFDEVSDGLVGYRADGHASVEDFRRHVSLMSGCDLEAVIIKGDRWRPSMHMPRWASRITLLVADVRVERLHSISTADIYAEGAIADEWLGWREDVRNIGMPAGSSIENERDVFERLWRSVSRPGSWESNPWVAVHTFKPVLGNIDKLEPTNG